MAKRGNFKLWSSFEYYSPGWGGIALLVFWLLVGVLLGNGVTLLLTRWAGSEAALEYGTLLSYPIMFIPPMLYASVKSRSTEMSVEAAPHPLEEGRFAPLGGWLCALLVVVATIAAGVCTDAINAVMPPMPEWLKDTLSSMTEGNFWINFVCVCLFAPFFEEWLCRGMVLRGLLDHKVKPVWAILLSALFFGLIHGNIWQMVPAILIGALFGYVYWKTRSLKLTMLMHFTNNLLALVVSRIPSLAEANTWLDVLGVWYWLLFAASALIIMLFFRAFQRIRS